MIRYLRNLYGDSLLRNSFYLVLATGVMAVFGFFFWLISTRLVSVEAIGLATTLVSVMNMIAVVSLIGFDTAFVRFLPSSAERNDSLNTGIILVSIASAIVSGLFVVFVSVISPQLSFVRESPLAALIFIAFCVMSTLNILTDAIFLAYRETRFSLMIDGVFSFLKMFLPFLLFPWGAFGIFSAAAIGQSVGFALSIWVLMRRFDYKPAFVISRSVLRDVWRYCTANYAADSLNLLPLTLLPVIITNHLGAASAAYYYIVMMIGNLLYVIPQASTRALFAEGSHDENSVAANIRKSIRSISYLLIPAILVLVLGGGEILKIFGKSYSIEGVYLLDIVALTGIFVSASSLYGSLFRISRNLRSQVIRNLCFAGSVIALAYILLPFGLVGVGFAWMGGNLLTSILCFFLYRRSRARIGAPAAPWPGLIAWIDNVQCDARTMISLKIYYLQGLVRNGFRTKTMLFYPDKPEIFHVFYDVAPILGYRISNDPRSEAAVAIAFQDTTIRTPDPVLDSLTAARYVINGRCADISKERVEIVFKEVFGYGLAVDPRTHQGSYVRKSNDNAMHDGTVLSLSTEPQAGYIYQRLINNIHDDRAVDIRTFVFKDSIPFTFFRYKSIEDRFGSTIHADRVEADAAFTKDERALIIRFCERFGMDCGELDIVRDNDDGRIYIVDANNTPAGPRPGKQVSRKDFRIFMFEVARAFEEKFLRPDMNA